MNEISINNYFKHHNDSCRKRDAKAGDKIQINSNVSLLNADNGKHDNIIPTAGPGSIGGGVFNFGATSFKPKDNSEGTMLSIRKLRKHSHDINDGHFT